MKTITVESIARACHEANKALREAVGDTSQKHWEAAEQWQRDSAVAGVQFRLNNPSAKDSAQHDAWCEDKVKAGWVYGPVKDTAAKTHPGLVPFEDLPPEQRAKDVLFCAVVDAIRPLLG